MAEAGAGDALSGKIESAPRIQMMRDLLASMGVEESDPKVSPLARRAPRARGQGLPVCVFCKHKHNHKHHTPLPGLARFRSARAARRCRNSCSSSCTSTWPR